MSRSSIALEHAWAGIHHRAERVKTWLAATENTKRKANRNWQGLEQLEQRVLLSAASVVDLNPALEPAIVDGLNSVVETADAVDQLDPLASNLPVVGHSIGQVIDFGGKIRDELVLPIQNYLASNDPTSSTELVNALNVILDGVGSPIDLEDESDSGVFKVRVKNFSFSQTQQNLDIDFGAAAEALNLDIDALLDFTPTVGFGIDGGVGFAFGLDLNPALSPAEAFFIDLTDTSLQFSVETPFADQGAATPLDFTLRLGMLGDVQVTGGQVDLNADLSVIFPDPLLTVQELTGNALSSLVSVVGSGNLAVDLPVSATVGGVNVGSANIAVSLTGDVFGDFDIDADIQAAAPDVAQAFKNFTNITPGDLVSSFSELANNLQALATQFDLPGGIPFVEDAVSEAVDLATGVQELTNSLFDLGLQSGIEVDLGALAGNADFDVIINGVATPISINLADFTDLAGLATEINDQLGVSAGVEAIVEEGRLALRAIDDAVQTLAFADVNDVATSVLGFVNDQTGIPFFDFITFDEFEDVVRDFLPGFAISYDAANQLIDFDLDLFESDSRALSLDFTQEIDLGGLATLSLAGGGTANLDTAARLRLSAGLDLTPLATTTKLADLNGGLGMRTDGTASADINVTIADGSVIGIDLDGLGADPTVADLIARIQTASEGKLEISINFTQDGLVLTDTTKVPGSGDAFTVAFAAGSAALADLGFGPGAGDVDDDGRIDGGTIISRLFLVPFDTGTGTGSFAAVGLDAAASDLRLGAALGILQVALTGGTSDSLELVARGELLDPDSSGKIFLGELVADPVAAVDVGFGTFAGADLTGAFSGFSAGDTISSFELALQILNADTYGIDLAGELASIQINLEVQSVAGLIPTLDVGVDIDTAALPNFSDILSSFQNLSIPQIINLVADLVVQFQDFPLFQLELPVLDQSIGDLVTFVSDKIDDILGDFSSLRTDLEALLDSTLDALRDQADTLIIDGQNLAEGLEAIGIDRQERLFNTLEELVAAIQTIPADFDIRFDSGQAQLVNLAGAFRALQEVLGEIRDEVVPGAASASAVADFFTTPLASVPALSAKSFVGLVASQIPSGDRVVRLVMESLGLDLFDLSDAANAAILTTVTTARDAVQTALENPPDLPDGDLGDTMLNDARDAAQAALDETTAFLNEVYDRLEMAVADQSVFAAVRSVQFLTDAISQLKTAAQTLIDNGDAIFDTAITDLTAFVTSIISDVRDQVFQAFPLGAVTFSTKIPGSVLFNLHFARQIPNLSVDVEFDLDDAGLPEIIPFDVNAGVTGSLDLAADFMVGFGLDLDPDSLTFLEPFLDRTSEVALTADVDLAVNGSAGIGGFSIDIVDGIVKLSDNIDLGDDGAVGGIDGDADDFGGPAKLGLGLSDPDDTDKGIFFSEIGLSIFDPILEAALLVNLPIEAGGNPLGEIFALVGITDFTEFDVQIGGLDADLIDEILNGLTELSLENIIAGMRFVFDTIVDGLESDLIGQLPLIGDDLQAIGGFLDELDAKFLTPVETFITDTLAGAAEDILEQLQKVVFDTLGPGLETLVPVVTDIFSFTPLNFLLLDPNHDGDPTLSFTDVPIAFTGADITDPLALTFPEAGYEFDLTFGFDEIFSLPLDFSLGGLGLGIEGNPTINVDFAPTFDISFGLNRLQGFYVNLDVPGDPNDVGVGETGVSVGLDVLLDPASALTLKLFFLDLTASVADGGSVGFTTSADIGFGTGQLTFSSLEHFSPLFEFTASADADLEFVASLAGQQSLPSLTAGLDVDWDFTLNQDGIDNTIDVSYTDVAVDLGDFFRDNIAPVIDTVNQFFQPLQPIFDVVQAEIPVISDLSELLGQGPVTFLDLVSLLGSGFEEVGQFIDTLAAVSDIVTTLGSIADDLGDGIIEYGDLALGDTIDFSDVGARSLVKTFDDATALSKDAAAILSQFNSDAQDKINNLKTGNFSSNVGVTNGAFHFPVIEDPFGTVAGFLLGQTSDLAVWDLPDFVAEFGFKQLFGPIFPPIPLFVSIFGNFRFATDFAVGFDTRGIQQSFADFYKGFYFRDWADSSGNGILEDNETAEARELGLDMEFGAGAELNVVVASAGVEGGINAGITADWNDVLEDGKFYIDEVGQRLSQGLECIFDLSGALDAFLRAFVKIGFDTPFGFVTLFEESLNLVNVTLLDFSASCPPLPIPQPGSDLDVGNDSPIYLNVGPRAGQRQPGATDIAEIVEVYGERDLDPGQNTQFQSDIVDFDVDGDIDSDDVDAFVAGGGTVSAAIDLNADNMIDTDEARLIEDFNANGTIGTTQGDKQSILLIGFGQWQLFLNSATGIIGDAGAEDDQILFDHSVQVPGTISGGPGKDKVQGGQANDVLFGDSGEVPGAAGEDTLIAGFGDDEIHGGDLDDQIFGNAGSDMIYGDGGNDTIAGDDGNNVQPVVLGLDGKPLSPSQLVSLSSLMDTVHAGAGEDNIMGEFGDDDLYGESGPDQLTGGWGDDLLDGGSEPDLLEGNEGSDTIYGRGGNDLIFGEADGLSTAGDGNDIMDGGDDNDTIRDDRGDDTAIGYFGDDFIVTGVGNDVIFGDLDPRGGGAPPAGYNGQDVIFGDRDALPDIDDGLGLGNGADYIEGGGNQDVIRGGAGPDRIIGGGSPFSGTNFGGTDAGDQIFGEDGDDIIAGDNAQIGTSGDVTSAATVTTFSEGGAGVDLILGAADKDIIFGGGAGDTLSGDDAGGTWADIVVGDQGTLTATTLEALHSGVLGSGGQDRLQGFGGNDILLGGDDNDTIIGNLGDDVIAGDNATVTFAGGVVVRTETRDEMFGGDDLINGDAGADVAFGGTGNDIISGGGVTDQADILFGDNGVAVLQDGSADENDLFSTDPTLGGTDTIYGGVGNDIIVGGSGGDDTTGVGGDDLLGQADDDIVVGDNARINRTSGAAPVVEFVKTIFGNDGGDDDLFGNVGLDILIGGFGSDQIQGNENDDIMIGDNGGVYSIDDPATTEPEGDNDVQTLDLIRSFTDGLGNTDTISGNGGADVAMGGTAGDVIYGDDASAGAGADDLADILLGDNGDMILLDLLQYPGAGADAITIRGGTVATIQTTDQSQATGGTDTISGNAADDIIAGGVLGDTLYGDATIPGTLDGNDIMLGDNGRMQWLYQGDPAFGPIESGFTFDNTLTTLDLVTTELPIAHPGGRDQMFGDDGKDLMFGGEDSDTMSGDDGDLETATATGDRDVMFGDHGRLYSQHSALPDFPSRNFFAIDTGDFANGEGDRMWGEEGDDVMLGQQGDDRMFGGSDDDDMIGGHNVAGGFDELSAPAIVATLTPAVNDLMDGDSGDDAMAGDNAIMWRRGDDVSPRFRHLTEDAIYTTSADGVTEITTNVGSDSQSDPNDVVGRDIELLDHADTTPDGLFGADVMAGGADHDVMYGQLADDLMQGDGSIDTADDGLEQFVTHEIGVDDSGSNPDTDETLYFNVPELSTDADDYLEGNGGNDLMYGGLGQDDIIGGSSELFGLVTEVMRPDGSDIIFGGAGAPARLARNDFVGATDTDAGTEVGVGAVPTDDDPSIALADRHSRDADFIMGDNANVFRLVDDADNFLEFNYDQSSDFEGRGNERIVVRAMEQLDYTLGGADYHGGVYINGAAQVTGQPADNGLGDLIHGESGDDYVFGMTGSDVIFGESDDDDIVGGYGNDWVSGGTGQDSVLGDDGLLLTSRNSEEGEPLYGITGLAASDPSSKYAHGTVLDEVISTPGNIQQAVINVTGQLKKTADLVPFSYDSTWLAMDDEFPDNDTKRPFADDIIFGGLDDDFLHGGSGDDAVSGAEALPQAYVPTDFDVTGTPQGVLDLGYNAFDLAPPVNPGDTVANPNPGDVLAFNPVDLDGQHLNNRFRAGEFFLYDEYEPLRRILLTPTGELYKEVGGVEGVDYFEFLLNFDAVEGVFRPEGQVPKPTGQQVETYPDVNDDGADAVFGDLGNDWLVGGTGRDNLYGGFGNDLLNADDDHTTNGDLNDQPDTHPTFEDRAYGGAGRDVLIANTGGDRLIDWVGEYNSYLVPFAPFGQASVSRTLQPFLPEFLYALSAGDGADHTRYTDAIGGVPPLPTRNSPNPSRNGEPFGELGLVLQRDFPWHDQTGAPADPQAGNIPGGHRDVLRSANFSGPQGGEQGFFVDSGLWSVNNGRYQVEPQFEGGDALSVFLVDRYVPNYFEVLATLNAVKPTGGFKANVYLVFDYQTNTDFKFAGINVSTNKLEIGHRTEADWVVDVQGSYQGSLKSDTDYNAFVSVNGTAVTLIVDNQESLTYTFEPRVDEFGFVYNLNHGMVGLGGNRSKATIDNMIVQRLAPVFTLDYTVDFQSGTSDLFQPPTSGQWNLSNDRYDGTASEDGPAINLTNLIMSPAAVVDLSVTLSVTGDGGFIFDRYDENNFKFVTISAGRITIGHHTNKGGFTDVTYSNSGILAGTDYALGLTLKGTTVSVTLDDQPALSHAFNALVTDGQFGLLSLEGTTSFDTVTVKSDDPAFGDPPPALTAAASPVEQVGANQGILTQDDLPPIIAEAIRRVSAVFSVDGSVTDLATVTFQVADLPDLTLAQFGAGTILLDRNAAGHGWFIDTTPRTDGEFGLKRDTPKGVDLLTVMAHELGHVLGLEHSLEEGLMAATLEAGVRLVPTVKETGSTASESRSTHGDHTVRTRRLRRVAEGISRRSYRLEPMAASTGRAESVLERLRRRSEKASLLLADLDEQTVELEVASV